MATFNSNGLIVDRFNEIIASIEEAQHTTIPHLISYGNSNTVYQLNSVYARPLDQVSQLVESAFDSLKLSSAEGRNLEELGLLRGVYRIPASPSRTTKQLITLKPGAVIQEGSLFSSSVTGVEAISTATVTGTPANCVEATVTTPNTILDAVPYGWSINGTNYQYLGQTGDTVGVVHAALILELNADTTKDFTYTTHTDTQTGLQAFTFVSDEGTILTVSPLNIKHTVVSVKALFPLELVQTGAIPVKAGELDTLVTPVVGFFDTVNLEDFVLGRGQETDVELRLRIQSGARYTGTGTPDTIIQSLLSNVEGVTYADVRENLDYTTGFPVNAFGLPWLKYEVVVLGGADEEVAQDIWRTRPVSADTWGNVSNVPVVDSSGETKFVSFSRPIPVLIDIEIDYVLYSEEDFPDGGDAIIQNAVIQHIGSLPLGKDVIAGRIFPVVYGAVSGVGNLVVRVKRSSNASFTTDRIAIFPSEYASTALANVTVTDVT